VNSRQSQSLPSQSTSYGAGLNTNELSLFQGGQDAGYSDDYADESFGSSPSGSYRIYVGLAVAIVIFALGYMAWRSAQSTSQNSYAASPPPPEIATEAVNPESPSTSASTSPLKTDPAERTPPANNSGAVAAKKAAEPSSPVSGKGEAGDDKVSAAAATPAARNSPQAPAFATTGAGAEELTTAQAYLNGTSGQQRNTSEAAKWLWKAIAKHNATASLLLADLYLKGDGVSKNCDQARVLLDAAALKGAKDAGARLRHLQAFGCD